MCISLRVLIEVYVSLHCAVIPRKIIPGEVTVNCAIIKARITYFPLQFETLHETLQDRNNISS